MPEITLLTVLGIAVLITLVWVFKQEKKLKSQKETLIETMKAYGTIRHDHHRVLLTLKDETYEVKFFRLHPYQDLCINSRKIWEIRGSGKPRLLDQSAFLAIKHKKIVIIYPSTQTIKRFINENELEFVSYKQSFFDMYVVKHHELDVFLSEMTS